MTDEKRPDETRADWIARRVATAPPPTAEKKAALAHELAAGAKTAKDERGAA